MKKYLINYAAKGTYNWELHAPPNGGYVNAQILNSQTALQIAGFDEVVNYNPTKLNSSFFEKHKEHFKYTRGAGYWIWKSFIIKTQLENMNEGDLLLYSDSGCHFIKDMKPIFDKIKEHKTLVFNLTDDVCIEKKWTKRDCLVEMNGDVPEVINTQQIMSTFFGCLNNEFNRWFASKWYEFSSNFHMIADEIISPSKHQNYNEFSEHRHDQSILSVLSKLNKVYSIDDITQNGRNKQDYFIQHTRWSN